MFFLFVFILAMCGDAIGWHHLKKMQFSFELSKHKERSYFVDVPSQPGKQEHCFQLLDELEIVAHTLYLSTSFFQRKGLSLTPPLLLLSFVELVLVKFLISLSKLRVFHLEETASCLQYPVFSTCVPVWSTSEWIIYHLLSFDLGTYLTALYFLYSVFSLFSSGLTLT